MADSTNDLLDKYYKRFPESMSYKDIADELDQMDPHEARDYDKTLCDELIDDICERFISFTPFIVDTIISTEIYKILKRRYKNIIPGSFYKAWIAFMEQKNEETETHLHALFQRYVNDPHSFDENEISYILLIPFKNAYKGFWSFVKQEISSIPHDQIAVDLCDIIEAFYSEKANEELLDILIAAYQKYPESHIINEMMGIVYYDNKQYGNAIAAYERLYIEEKDTYYTSLLNPTNVRFELAYANDKMRDRKTAISYYEKVVEDWPEYPYAANNLGYAYYRERQYDKAYTILKRCIDEKLEPDLKYPVNNFARLLYAMGRYQEAKEFLKTAPTTVEKSIRKKIENAPSRDAVKIDNTIDTDETEDVFEPPVKETIKRKGVQFQSEKILEDELILRMESGVDVFGLHLKIYKRRGEYGRQYIIKNGRIDILAEDPNGNLYIIELKKDSGYDDPYKQLTDYMDWVQKHKAKGKKVYGIICLNAPGKTLVEAVRQDDRVKLFEYQISYTEIK